MTLVACSFEARIHGLDVKVGETMILLPWANRRRLQTGSNEALGRIM